MKEVRNYSEWEIVSVSIYDNTEYPMHYHPDPEMIFVIRGAARVHTSYYTIDRMEENEFLFINSGTVHNIEKIGEEPCTIMSMHFHMKDIAELFSLPELAAFSIASFDEYCSPHITAQLRKYLIDIAGAYYSLPAAGESELSDKVLECYTYMMNNFQWFYYEDYILRNYPQRLPLAQITRAEEILNYVQAHYSERLTLAGVADAFYLNKYYLSHLLKDSLGMNFQDIVNAIRLNIALYPLLDSQKSVDEIAEECGFSSAAYFRKAFAKQAKVPLSRYRKTYAKRTLTNRQPDIAEYSAEEQQRLLTEYKKKYFPGEFFSTGVERIPVNVELKKPPYRKVLPEELRCLRLTPQALMAPDQLRMMLDERRVRAVVADEADFAEMRAACGPWDIFEPAAGLCREAGVRLELRGDCGSGMRAAGRNGSRIPCGSCKDGTGAYEPGETGASEISAMIRRLRQADGDPVPAVSGTEFSMYGCKGLRTRWYYLYFLIDQLCDEVIFESGSCTITRDGSELAILFCNVPDAPDTPAAGGAGAAGGSGAKRKEIFLHLEDIECNYTMISYTFDFFAESEEDVWRAIGAPDGMGAAVRETIRSSCFPDVVYAHSTSQYDLLREIVLEPGELKLLRLIPERSGSE